MVLLPQFHIAQPLLSVASDIHPACSFHFLTPFLGFFRPLRESIFFSSSPPQNYIFSSAFSYILSLALTIGRFQFLGGTSLFRHTWHHAVQQIIGSILDFQQVGIQLVLQPHDSCACGRMGATLTFENILTLTQKFNGYLALRRPNSKSLTLTPKFQRLHGPQSPQNAKKHHHRPRTIPASCGAFFQNVRKTIVLACFMQKAGTEILIPIVSKSPSLHEKGW